MENSPNQEVPEGLLTVIIREKKVKLTTSNGQKLESWIMLSVVREAGMQVAS